MKNKDKTNIKGDKKKAFLIALGCPRYLFKYLLMELFPIETGLFLEFNTLSFQRSSFIICAMALEGISLVGLSPANLHIFFI